MVALKLETAYRPEYLALDTGDTWHGFAVLASVVDSPQMVIDVPDDAAYDRFLALVESGDVVDFRVSHADYVPLWLPDTVRPFANEQPGDTFAMLGVTDTIRQRGRYGAGVVVALCDTGLDAQHVAFAGKRLAGDLTDAHGHGSHTASSAASSWGVASDATIWMANVLPGGNGTEAGVANGIRAAADYITSQRAPGVLSLSLGGSHSSVISDAVRYVQQRGIPVVAAAGNEAGAVIGSPADAADIVVMACDRQRALATFTSGRTWDTPNRVVAPGVNIAAAQTGSREGVMVASGTSMATPQVAGAVALLLAAGV